MTEIQAPLGSILTSQVTLDVPQESRDIIDFIDGLLEDILAKKDAMTVVTENLPTLVKAVDGYDEVAQSFSDESRSALAAYLVKVLMDRLVPTKKA